MEAMSRQASAATIGNATGKGAMMKEKDTSLIESSLQSLKLEVPRQRISLVDRPRLLSELNIAARSRLCLLVAPPGFGKTTVLAQWRDQIAKPDQVTAWLTLDEGDSEPGQFLSYVIFAFAKAGIGMDRLLSHAEQGLVEIGAEACLRLLVSTLIESDKRTVLILDDFHRASNDKLDSILLQLIQMLPETATIVVSSRSRPDIPMPRLLAAGLASEVNADPLRLTRVETRELLGTELPETDLAMLLDQTEGWPVALQLARLVLKNGHSPITSIKQLTARGGHLSSYLADQVLKFLSADIVEFLLETSILERFNVSLANAVRARTDSWDIMAALEPLQSLLTPLDAQNEWVRYHHLFSEYLQGLLSQKQPESVHVLHLRASEWFEQNGFILEAVKHAGHAGDFERCASLIEGAGGWQLILYGGIGHLRNLLRLMPRSEQLAHPRILIADAYLKLKDGQIQAARTSFDLADTGIVQDEIIWDGAGNIDRDAINVGLLLKAYEDNAIDVGFIEHCEHLRTQIPPYDGLTLGVLDCTEAVAALCLGHLEKAEIIARAAMKSMRAASSVLGLNYCFLHAGLSTLYRGRCATAGAYLLQAREMAEENFGADSGLKSICDVFSGALNYWRTGGLGVSHDAFLRSFEHVRAYDGWCEAYAVGLDLRFRHAFGRQDWQELREIIAEGRAIVAARGLQRLDIIVEAQSLMLAMATEERAEARVLARRVQEKLPVGCWQGQPYLWRPYQDGALALALWAEENNKISAKEILDDLVACCSAVGSKLYLVRALVRRGLIHESLGDRQSALSDLSQAISLAAPEAIRGPFLEDPSLRHLLATQKKRLRQESGDPIEESFVAALTGNANTAFTTGWPDRDTLFSPREMDVIQELLLGLTNKEIARALDMTDHTVKFHLRNIFSKLGVDRRAHAIAAIQSRSLHT